MNYFRRATPAFSTPAPVPPLGDAGDDRSPVAQEQEPENTLENKAPDTVATGGDSVATLDEPPSSVAGIEENLAYTLTIPEAQARIISAGRKAPSDRSMQRYANDPTHLLCGMKVSTTQGQEFLLTPSSVDAFIATLPKRIAVSSVTTVPTRSDAGDGGDAIAPRQSSGSIASQRDDSADTDAEVTTGGERRTVGSVLQENAKLLGQLEGKDELIKTQRDVLAFLQDELTEHRKHRGEVKDIADRMLGIIEMRSLPEASKKDPEPANAAYTIKQSGEEAEA